MVRQALADAQPPERKLSERERSGPESMYTFGHYAKTDYDRVVRRKSCGTDSRTHAICPDVVRADR